MIFSPQVALAGVCTLLDPAYAAKVPHIVLVPVARQRDWRHHFGSSMALVDMAISELGGDATRVTVAGQSMGAHGAWLYASQLAPSRFCAVITMCGYLDSDAPIGTAVPPGGARAAEGDAVVDLPCRSGR